MIERGNILLVETLGDRQDCGIHQADVRIGILLTDLPYAAVVGKDEVLDSKDAGQDVVQEGKVYAAVEPRPNVVIHLYEDGSRHDQRPGERIEKCATAIEIRLVTIESSNERSGVDYERHGSGRYSSLAR